MKIKLTENPRKFFADKLKTIEISDFGKLVLEPNEMISFETLSGKGLDFSRKNWGYYATPSINDRLKREGFKTALVRNANNQVYIMVVDTDELDSFHEYLETEKNSIVQWLDEIPLDKHE